MSRLESNRFYNYLDIVASAFAKIQLRVESVCNTRKYRFLLWGLVISACFAILFTLNHLTPLISDDFAYLFIYGEKGRVASIGDVVQSQINHYYMWGGRSVVHFIAQVLLMLPDYVTDILNTLLYLAYIFLIYFLIKARNTGSISLFILINLAVWFFQPVFGDTILWLTGSANYLWGTVFILLFLLPYRFYEGKKSGLFTGILASIVFFFFGIIAGWTNENTAGAMILLAGLFLIYYYHEKLRIPFWSIAGLIGAIAGYCIMILAPGNFERAGDSVSLSFFILAYRLFNCTLTFLYYSGPFFLVCLIIFILYCNFPEGIRKEKLVLSFFYSIAALAAVYAMLLSPTFPRRALFGVVTYLIIGGGILFYNLDFKQAFLRQIRSIIILVGLVSFVFTFYLAVKEINTFRNIMKDREVKMEQAKVNGDTTCEFEMYLGGSYIHGEDPFSEELMSRYYGIRIKLKNPQN